ncbi:MAG: bifunctional (p)ppGpp synthetase/guanosine-3',5'-bis(diphosphate) 3'-pyrophosphohydrolase [Cytophagales bacterium]|nr:bifunctional (p)ppGpp synthetase/guanosine-3',5'-bis(diphosphate) 3'-pyrophosphohydrolase [Cytophagales bacterium]
MAYNLTEEQENQEIVRRYRELLKHAKPYIKEGDTKIIKKAFHTAVDAHKEMRRKSGEPYIFHPIAVAQIAVEEIGLGPTSIVAALLHDVVEDTPITLEEIEKGFGKKVAMIIDGLTKISGGHNVESQQAENFRKMVLTLSEDVRVILVKLADRLHNMRTLGSMPRHKQLKIASETIYFYAPLAHRLGLYAIKTELEDLYLKYAEPESYQAIQEKLSKTAAERTRNIREFIRPVQAKLRDMHLEFKIKGRSKSVYSIWKKMNAQQIPFEEVYDLLAVRIIVEADKEQEKTHCWNIYSVITDFYRPKPDRLRDWISNPKSNGYESLHSTVMNDAGDTGKWVEVQIRTTRMDEIAEKGYAAHWKYKDKDDAKSGLDEWIGQVSELLSQHKEGDSAVEFIQDFRTNLFNKEIFVFTPTGDAKVLPTGGTVLDFAFDLHTQVGLHCTGAYVNHKVVPKNHKLKNGDQIKVLTSDTEEPTKEWYEYVSTSKARKKIKDFLNEKRRNIAGKGEKITVQKFGIDFGKYNRRELLFYLNKESLLDVYYEIGQGEFDEKVLIELKEYGIEKLLERKANQEEEVSKRAKELNKKALLVGETQEEVDYVLASCCNPIHGDDVLGYVTADGALEIHKTKCERATELMANYGYRVVKAKWNESVSYDFDVTIKVIGTDRRGFITDVSAEISKLDLNITCMKAETKTGIIEDTFTVSLNSSQLLDKLLDNLRKVPQVITVERVDDKKEKKKKRAKK